jgi:hypothetical protein
VNLGLDLRSPYLYFLEIRDKEIRDCEPLSLISDLLISVFQRSETKRSEKGEPWVLSLISDLLISVFQRSGTKRSETRVNLGFYL